MTLDTYIKSFPRSERRRLRKKIADDVGVAESTIRSWANGTRKPKPSRLESIVIATKGKVTKSHLRPDIFGDLDKETTA